MGKMNKDILQINYGNSKWWWINSKNIHFGYTILGRWKDIVEFQDSMFNKGEKFEKRNIKYITPQI